MALDEEYSRKPNLWIWMKNIPGNPTCGSGRRIFQETQPVNLDEEYSWKPNLWTWMKNIPGNPTYGSGRKIFQGNQPVFEETVVAVYLFMHNPFISFICFTFDINAITLFFYWWVT